MVLLRKWGKGAKTQTYILQVHLPPKPRVQVCGCPPRPPTLQHTLVPPVQSAHGRVVCAGHGALGRHVNHKSPSPPSAPWTWAQSPSWPMRISQPLSHREWRRDGQVTSAGPIRDSRVTEICEEISSSTGWELEKDQLRNARGWEPGCWDRTAWVPDFCQFPVCDLRKPFLGFLVCEVGPRAAPAPQGH